MPRFTLDHHGGADPPKIGDALLSERLVYRVTEARPVESLLWPDRWRLQVERVALRSDWDGAGFDEGARVIPTTRYERGERPTDHRCDHPACEGCNQPAASGHH